MLQKIESEKRNFKDYGWLQTYWLFSFSEYYDPLNVNHGALRVFNDDVVLPHRGFGTHPHEEMEIVSIVLKGEMVHADSMGNKQVIRENDVQRMTAGTGLQHSEMNESDESVSFFQIWILPDKKGLAPSYDQKTFTPDFWKDRLALLASDRPEDGVVSLNSEASVYRADLGTGKEVGFATGEGSCQFLYVVDGSAEVNGVLVERRDQLRIDGENRLQILTDSGVDFVLIEIPKR